MRLRHPNAIESARQARRSIHLIRQRLLNPTAKALESCTPHLRAAIASLERLQHELETPESQTSPDRNVLRTEMSELRRELAQVNALMQNASAFHAAMSYLLPPSRGRSISY